MKKKLFILSSIMTSITLMISIYLATVDNPTDIQKQLSTTANAVTVAGATAIFGLMDDD
jgi:uncharacterized membrane-anchored protein